MKESLTKTEKPNLKEKGLKAIQNTIEAVRDLRFSHHHLTKLLQESLGKNWRKIVESPDFEKKLQSLSRNDLHVHPLKVSKKNGIVLMESTDDERLGPNGKLNFFKAEFNIKDRIWLVDGNYSPTEYQFLIQSIIEKNPNFAQFGNGEGSFSTVARREVPGYEDARKELNYEKRFSIIKDAKAQQSNQQKLDNLMRGTISGQDINSLPTTF